MNKKKVLILTAFFPPSTNTAANRALSWTMYLPKKNYPIIITWDWKRSTGGVEIKKYDNYEIHYLPRKLNLYNRVLEKSLKTNNFLKKPLLFIQLLLSHIFPYFTNNEKYNHYFKNYLTKEKVDIVISSASPFILHVLVSRQRDKYEFKHIADYRDPWSNNKMIYKESKIFRIIQSVDSIVERKVSKKYDFLLAPSDYLRKKICEHIRFPLEKSATMLNGFFKMSYSGFECKKSENFQILFSGTFYPNQLIEHILNVINDKLENGSLPMATKIIFLGARHVTALVERIQAAIVGFEKYYEISERIPYDKSMAIQQNSDLLVMPSYVGLKGVPSSKLFDYVSSGIPILLYPSDEDVIEEILIKTKLGLICNNADEISESLDKLVAAKFDNIALVQPELKSIQLYSREEQTKVLADTINKLLS